MPDRDMPDRDVTPALATVTPLPCRDTDDTVDAEIVTEAEWRAIQQRKMAAARRADYRRDVTLAVTGVRHVVTHPVTRTCARHASYIVAGAWIVARRRHRLRTLPTRMALTAEAKGDTDAAKYWFERHETSKEARHRRRKDWIELPFRAARALAVGIVVWALVLLLLGIIVAINTGDVARAFDPILGFVTFVGWLWWLATVGWAVALCVAGCVTAGALWHVGRNADAAPAWLAPSRVTRDDQITPSRVVLAFRELGIAPLRKAIADMEDGGASMLSPIVTAGRGIEVAVTLPIGVTTAEVIARRRKLAENLGRQEHEVFPTVAREARTVTVWAADTGALDEPIGASPLAYDDTMRADYKRGRATWGESLRSDPVAISLYQRHLLITGQSNQGKSASVRALALWLALDRTVEFRIADLKGVGDWAMFDGIATVLIEGPADEHVIAATEMIEDAVTEMNRRLATGKDGRWTPLVCIVDEAQVAYMCPAKDAAGVPYGGSRNTSRYLTAVRQLQNQGRAVDVVLWQGTQNPTNQNLPVLAREGAHLRICLAVGTEEQSRMALGDKAVDGGAAPHLLRAGLDKGTVVVAGDGAPLAPGQASVTVRTHFIDDATARDIAARAKALRGPVVPLDVEEQRDLLDDVYELMGDDERMRASELAVMLRRVAPGYRPYANLDGVQLAEQLANLGVPVRVHKGFPKVAAVDVLRVLDGRRVSDR